MADNASQPDEELDDLLSSIKMERTLGPAGSESDEALARRIFKENAPLAAASIAKLALHGQSERTRLDASKYVIERVLGPAGNDTGSSDPLADFLRGVEALANKGS
jgi:hypothetical protein